MTATPPTEGTLHEDPAAFASSIGLRYAISGSDPCVRRRRCGRGYTYRHSLDGPIRRGHPLRSWLDGLALPPAWSDVWITPHQDSHLIATGYDSAERKQYRYHDVWSEARRRHHDGGLVRFARRLPALRAEVERVLTTRSRVEARAHAAAARVLDRTGVRIGNLASVDVHGTYGLTTLTSEHLSVDGPAVHLSFLGKGGAEREIDLEDPQLARILRSAAEHDDAHLFSWRSRSSAGHVTARSLNSFLKQHLGSRAHAHQFRSWLCTWRTIEGLRRHGPANPVRSLIEVLEPIAHELGHTVSTARAHYLHHTVEPAWVDGSLPRRHPVRVDGLSLPERRAIAVLEALTGAR